MVAIRTDTLTGPPSSDSTVLTVQPHTVPWRIVVQWIFTCAKISVQHWITLLVQYSVLTATSVSSVDVKFVIETDVISIPYDGLVLRLSRYHSDISVLWPYLRINKMKYLYGLYGGSQKTQFKRLFLEGSLFRFCQNASLNDSFINVKGSRSVIRKPRCPLITTADGEEGHTLS